jgi:dipeptidyl aminopeptidase/acylaminoacyl peptidase
MSDEEATDPSRASVLPSESVFGWWPSPWSASDVAAGKVSRSGLQSDGDAVYWSESRPGEGGRQVVVRSVPGAPVADVSPGAVSVRSRVHEYGGAAATVAAGRLYFVDQGDQRWYRTTVGDGADLLPLTPEPPYGGPTVRYADGRVTRQGTWLVSVEERLADGAAEHRLVAVAVDGSQQVVSLVDGGDFVSSPRLSPDGQWLAWVTWDHPSMPWDSSEVRVARLHEADGTVGIGRPHRVAGGDGVAVGQPQWCRDGSLLFVDDRSGWWLPYRLAPGNGRNVGTEVAGPLVDVEGEFHAPDWVLGQATMAELSDGSIACRMRSDGRDRLVHLQPGTDGPQAPHWLMTEIDQPCVTLSGVAASPAAAGTGRQRVCILGSTPTEAQGVFEISPGGRFPPQRLSAPPGVGVARADVSVARPFRVDTDHGPVPGLFFAPASATAEGPARARPPLVVFCHGGPTGAAESGFDPVVQFFTSRGLAVAAVDYRGSSGYGRSYRKRLDGEWGVADIDDCADVAVALDREGWVDGSRMAIRGGSAGGLTALGALIRSRRFAGAVAWYGVTDLETLATDTHDFESRYVDSLVGPWPEAAERYRSRSPIHHADQVSGAVLLLQGADDPVVPAAQSERFAAELAAHRVPCRLIVFEGESHGFRRAATIEACLEAELSFYRSLFGTEGEDDAPATGG